MTFKTTAGSGLGRYFVRTNRSYLTVFSGAVWNHERYFSEAGATPGGNEVEALGGVDYTTFRFDKTRFDTRLLVFPSLSSGGRVRLDWKSNFRVNMVGDLYWKASLYGIYDSAPPSNTRKGDYGATATLGWSC